jgi:hypothetical protein
MVFGEVVLLFILGSNLGRWVYSFGLIFVSARTNKRHHHLQPVARGDGLERS